mgnify:CR=1 FL=1
MSEINEIRATLIGKVQGVGFRYFTKKTANALDLTGWVRNCEDGTVELCAQGPEDTLQTFMHQIEQAFPGASVDDLVLTWHAVETPYKHFEITF